MSIRVGDTVTSILRHGTFQVVKEDKYSHTFLLEDPHGEQFWISRVAVEKSYE